MMRRTWLTLAALGLGFALGGCNRTTIWEAAHRGDTESARWIAHRHPEQIDQLDEKNQWTPVQWAIANSYGETAAELLKHGADPNIQSGDGRTARDFASEVPNEIMQKFIFDSIDGAIARREAEASREAFALQQEQARQETWARRQAEWQAEAERPQQNAQEEDEADTIVEQTAGAEESPATAEQETPVDSDSEAFTQADRSVPEDREEASDQTVQADEEAEARNGEDTGEEVVADATPD